MRGELGGQDPLALFDVCAKRERGKGVRVPETLANRLSDEMNLRRLQRVEQHKGDNGKGTIFSDFSRFVE